MKKISCVVLFLFLSLASKIHAQDLQLFTIYDFTTSDKDTVAFISLSDIYPLSHHPDSLAIPDTVGKTGYFKLDAKYRKRLLTGTKVSEKDKIFIYDYANDVLHTFTVKDLPAVARLNIYTSPEECPCPPYYYMIGLEISGKLLKGFTNYYSTTLVYIGKKNPFVRGQLKPITWKPIEPEKYQSAISGIEDTVGFPNPARGQVYAYETKEFHYYVQDESRNSISRDRHFLILNSKTKEIVYKHIFSDSEGSSLAPLNGEYVEQWTGKLFKNQPTVIFGFVYESFSCTGITVLSEPVSYIDINCDARH